MIMKFFKSTHYLIFLSTCTGIVVAFVLSLLIHHNIFQIENTLTNDMGGITIVFWVEGLIRPIIAITSGLLTLYTMSNKVEKGYEKTSQKKFLSIVFALTLIGNIVLTVVQLNFGWYFF